MASLHSYDEFSTLREVIVGSAANYTSHDRELSFDVFFHENLFRSDWAYPRLKASTPVRDRGWQIKQRYVDELNEDVEGLAQLLWHRGTPSAAAPSEHAFDQGFWLGSDAGAGPQYPRQYPDPG